MTTTKPETLPADLRARKYEAEVAKTESEARKAAAEATKAAADARGAEAAAKKAEAEEKDREDTLARQQREATARKAIAEADKDAAAARRAQLGQLIPDLGKVKEGSVEVKDGPPLVGSVLTFGALEDVAATIAKRIFGKMQNDRNPCRLLVTAEVDLATSDATYHDVVAGLEQLEAMAARLLGDPDRQAARKASVAGGLDLVAAVAAALPAILSLFSAKRTVSTGPVLPSDLAASAAVAGALTDAEGRKELTVVHDEFRLVPDSGVYNAAKQLNARRQVLIGRKLALSDEKTRLDSELTRAKSGGTELGPAPEDRPDLERRAADVAIRIGLIDSLLTAMDQFVAAVRVVPEGARRSALATAALYQLLHAPPPGSEGMPRFTHVLLVKGQQGQSQQLVDDRMLWAKDRFSTIVDVSVSYMLIDTSDSGILAAGTATSTARVYGKIGERPEVVVVPHGE